MQSLAAEEQHLEPIIEAHWLHRGAVGELRVLRHCGSRHPACS